MYNNNNTNNTNIRRGVTTRVFRNREATAAERIKSNVLHALPRAAETQNVFYWFRFVLYILFLFRFLITYRLTFPPPPVRRVAVQAAAAACCGQ